MIIYKIIEYFKNNIRTKPIFIFFLGCMSGLAFSSNSIFICVPLMFVALSSLFSFLYNIKTKNFINVFLIGSLFSFGQLFTGLYWISNAFDFIFTNGTYIGLIAIMFLALALSIFYGFSCIIIMYVINVWRLNLFGSALIFSVFLSLGEYLRGNLLGGFPWNIIGYIWTDSIVMMQSVSLIGIYGLGLFTFLASTSIILVFYRIKYGLYALLPTLFLFIYGEIRLNLNIDETDKFIQIRVVQPAINQNEKWDEKLKSKHIEKLISLSLIDNDKFKPKLILWPESSLPYASSKLEKNIEIFSWLSEEQVLIAGITRTKYKNNLLSKIYNSAVISDKLFNYNYYDKVKLVPFGEYNPFRKFFNSKKLTKGTLDFSSGENTNIYKLINTNLDLGILICYEIIFSSKVINGNRPDFLVNLTNDAWYGDTYGPLQHLAAARARAIEEGMPVLRSANTGISAVINQYGQYLKRLELGEEGVIDINMPLNKKKTIFSIFGNSIYLITLIFMLMLARFPFISKTSK